jgi:hypothetical protein
MARVFPGWLQSIGIVVAGLSVLLAARLAWEQTVWSWERGPQMVGFSLMHSGFGILLMLAVWAGVVWVAVALLVGVRRRSIGGQLTIWPLIVYGLAWVVMTIPYGLWQRTFIDRFMPRAAEFFTYDAAVGDLKTVEAFLQRGVNVNVQDRNGTALHGAAVEGELEIMALLISRGADVNAINAYGDTPLANAMEAKRNSLEAQALLTKHGARLVRGTKEHRDRVIGEQVRKDAEEMEKRMRK